MPRVLIVDDEESIRIMLEDFLEEEHEIFTARNAREALECCRSRSIDLVLSDINMPGLQGPELLTRIHTNFPGIRTVLMTAYNVDDYVGAAFGHGISSIIPKAIPFNFTELRLIVDGLLQGDLFGLPRYLHPGAKLHSPRYVRSTEDAGNIGTEITDWVTKRFNADGDIRLVLDEIITNAVYHSPTREDGKLKYREYEPVQLSLEESIRVQFGYDSEKYAVSITDYQGKLTKETVLSRLDRHIKGEGVLDDSGRGLHMSRLFSDRLFITILPEVKTEVVIINYFRAKYCGHKPLYVNVL